MHEPHYNNVVQKANTFLESSGPMAEKDEIGAKLDDIKTRWEELIRKTNERDAQLADVLPLAQKYHDNSQNVKDVVTLAETELGSRSGVSPGVEMAKQELLAIKVFRLAFRSTLLVFMAFFDRLYVTLWLPYYCNEILIGPLVTGSILSTRLCFIVTFYVLFVCSIFLWLGGIVLGAKEVWYRLIPGGSKKPLHLNLLWVKL